MNKDYTYCSMGHLCPRKRICKRYVKKHPAFPLMWIDLKHKTLEYFDNCNFFDKK